MLHLSLSLTALVAVAPLANTAPDAALAGNVPAEYAALIPQEVAVVAWIGSPQHIVNEARSLHFPGPIPKSLNDMFKTGFKTDVTIPLTDPIILWIDQFPKPGERGDQLGVTAAFKAHGANAQNVTALPGQQVFFSGDMMILRQGTSTVPWKKPAKPNTRLTSVLPSADLVAAFDGKQMSAELEIAMRQLSALGMVMAQGLMHEREQNAKPADREIIKKTQQQGIAGMQRLINGAVDVMKTVDIMTLSLNLKNGDLQVGLDMHYPTHIQNNHGVEMSLVESVPGGMPIYLAMDQPALRWFNSMKHDFMEVVLALDAAQIKLYEKMGKQASKLASLMNNGLAVGIGVEDRYEWMVMDVTNVNTFASGAGQLMKELNDLSIGIKTKPMGKDKWGIDVDGSKLAKLLGGSPFTQDQHARRWGGKFEWSFDTSGNRITSKRHPAGYPNFATSTDTSIRNILEPKDGGALIAGISMDMGPVMHAVGMEYLEDALQKDFPRDNQGKTQELPPASSPIPFSVLLTNPTEKSISLHIDLDAKKVLQYSMMLDFTIGAAKGEAHNRERNRN